MADSGDSLVVAQEDEVSRADPFGVAAASIFGMRPCRRPVTSSVAASTYIFIPAIFVHDAAHLRHAAAHSASPSLSHESAHARQMSAQALQIVADCVEPRNMASLLVSQICAQSRRNVTCAASPCLPPSLRQ